MKILILLEDHLHDQYIAKPVIEKLVIAVNNSSSNKVVTCQDPRFKSINELSKAENLQIVIDKYPMVDVIIIIADADGKYENRFMQLNRAVSKTSRASLFELCIALQELEVWALANAKDYDVAWQETRTENNPKETYFYPYIEKKSWINFPGKGRKKIMEKLNYSRIRQLCPELIELENALSIRVSL